MLIIEKVQFDYKQHSYNNMIINKVQFDYKILLYCEMKSINKV